MASNPRLSGLWTDEFYRTDDVDMGNEDGDEERQRLWEEDGRTPLDRTIDRIGMGSYQWTLLALCGFGWLADNMWIQTVAIILPRVQRHFSVPDSYIGYLSSSIFAGMMIGAIGWGSCSDLLGRSTAFNLTLFFTAVFGLVASFAPTFSWLCVAFFFLGTSVGGSMPTDGTLLLEHMPQGKQYLLTALSVFFSFGSVISAIIGIIVIPSHSCTSTSTECDVERDNLGWKYLLMSVGFVTLSFFLARIVFFRLHESPRYLVHAGRPEEAIVSLRKISRFNGSELSLGLHDVVDRPCAVGGVAPGTRDELNSVRGDGEGQVPNTTSPRRGGRVLFDASQEEAGGRPSIDASERDPFVVTEERHSGTNSPDKANYASTGSSNTPLDVHSFASPDSEVEPGPWASSGAADQGSQPQFETASPSKPSYVRTHITSSSRPQSVSRRSSLHEAQKCMYRFLPRWLRRPLTAWLDRIAMVLSPEWIRTTLLVWAMWCCMSLAYTMFNVFLPKMLEMRSSTGEGSSDAVTDGEPKSLERTMWDVVIFTIGGCPGAILGAYLVESSLGRRWSLAGSTLITAAFCFVFVYAETEFAIRSSTIGISLSSTTMWAVLYGWTPEIFTTSVRGTACGSASALSRIGGMIAPILGGALLMADRSLPVYTSIVVFLIAAVCTLCLSEDEGHENGGGIGRGGGGVVVH